jgi:tRNA threonylcarbamoyladenosine biosynthesis protein TsaB
MHLLAIETSEVACSAAIWSDGSVMERYREQPRGHSELLLPMIDSLISESGISKLQLDAIAFGRGPGSFTGVRIAAAVTQGISFGLDIPVVPVSSLQALAQGVYRSTTHQQVAAAFDARMHEVYWALCSADADGVMQLQGKEMVCAPGQVSQPQQEGWVGAGSGWDAYAEALSERLSPWLEQQIPHLYCHAQDVAFIAAHALSQGDASVIAAQALPLYLRNNVAKKSLHSSICSKPTSDP